MKRMASPGRWLLYITVIILGVCLLAELGLRVAGYWYLRDFYARNKPFEDGDIVIVCLGESSTAGLWVPWEESYPRRLQEALREAYRTEKIRVVVPPHVGQNTSQMANRISDYLDLYRPALVIVMAGINNEWALAESHIGEFLPAGEFEALKARTLIAFNNVRLYKVLRYAYLRVFADKDAAWVSSEKKDLMGHPEYVQYPPRGWISEIGNKYPRAFLQLWQRDVGEIVSAVKARGTQVLLMTYHLNGYLPVQGFIDLARRESVPLVRNDLSFTGFTEQGVLDGYILHDHWHPSSKGYAIIASNAFEVILEQDLLGLSDR